MKFRAGLAMTVLLSLFSVADPATATTQPVVAIYGDSMQTQAYSYFWYDIQQMSQPPKLDEHAWPGTAVCDWLTRMQQDATTIHPKAVLLLFVGNDSTPCMQGDNQVTSAVAAQYSADLTTAITTFLTNGTARIIVYAGPSYPVGSPLEQYASAVRTAEHDAVSAFKSPKVLWINSARSVDTPGSNLFTLTRNCVPYEITHNLCTGPIINKIETNKVRIGDGHFCQWPWPKGFFCAGAWRYGNSQATALMKSFNWTPLPPTGESGN